ncbi:hypothetical protein GWK53_39545, partial [Burkholderia cepacia]|uniref:hypothetical protein n=1 Tax=Burkholderia cepacia TaxID=292 RepID=UPI0013F3A683
MRLESEEWELKEAIQPVTRAASWVELEPSMEWWAEYERFEPIAGGVEGIDVRLSGHRTGLDRQIEEMPEFLGHSATIAGRRAIVGTVPDGPSTASIELANDYTVMALSYALDPDELATVAAEL